MAKKLYDEASVQAIADAIRAKNGSTANYKIAEMAAAILALSNVIEFDDRNDYVLNYLDASASYTAANRATVSVISQYASTSVQDQDCPKPFHGVYNLMPGVETTVDQWQVARKNVAPRMLKLENVWNVRDCGGYSADGGNVKYGMLFRGSRLNNATNDDLSFLEAVGIKLDLDIRDSGNAVNGHIPNADYLNVPLTYAYAQMIQSEATAAANAVKAAMESVVANKPVYIHCASGADRTGCICAMLEAVLGMSDADIDRDFELTCFSDTENLTGHHRNGGSWTGFWAALPTNQGSAKMNVVKFLRDNGVTTALLNSFRHAMIDGTPSDIDTETKSITNNLTGCTTSNSATSVAVNESYLATITPSSGYTLTTLTVTMGGVDITSTAVSGSTISIASVTGDVVITAFAEAQASYTNLVRTSIDRDGSVYNGVGYLDGKYMSGGVPSSGADSNATITGYIAINSVSTTGDVYRFKGVGEPTASHTRMAICNSSFAKITETNSFLGSAILSIFTLTTETASDGTTVYVVTVNNKIQHYYSNAQYFRFSFDGTSGKDLVITCNEKI